MGPNGGVSSGDGAAATALRAGLAPKRERPGILKPLDWVRVLARRKPLGFVGFLILLVVALAAAFAPLVAPYGYAEVGLTNRLQPPGGAHLFGTDNLGRDILSRVIWGARISLGISLGAMIIAKSLATVIAMFSAYYGGWFDKIMQRFVDVWIALPTLIILITLLGVLGANPVSLIIVIGLANAPQSSRLVRSVVLSVREEPYIEAARSLGMRDSRIMLLHVLPNIMHIIIYSASVTLGSVILIVASL
ncbi:MAG: ABC transporter permease, partial [Dehalococcoidia bacterium]